MELTLTEINRNAMDAILKELYIEAGQDVVTIELTYLVKKWEFPKERFVIYEPSDEPWCRALGIGREIEVEQKISIPRAILKSVQTDPQYKDLSPRYMIEADILANHHDQTLQIPKRRRPSD